MRGIPRAIYFDNDRTVERLPRPGHDHVRECSDFISHRAEHRFRVASAIFLAVPPRQSETLAVDRARPAPTATTTPPSIAMPIEISVTTSATRP